MNKRGISPVIATILLILITVAVVAIVWAGVRYFLISKTAEENICQKADIFISSSDVCYDSAKKITSVGITKGSNDIDIVRLQFVFSYEQADQSNIQEVEFDLNSKKIMYFDMAGIYSGAKPVKVKIIPIVKFADGNERICEAGSEVSVGDCDLKQEKGGYDGWLGCTTDQECIEKAGNNPNNISMTCVQILALKRGMCCYRGMCSGGPSDGGNTAGGGGTSIGGVPSGCLINCTGKQCGDDGCGGSCGSCAPPQTCNSAGKCECIPQCTGKQCGDDRCGGTCLPGCAPPATCNATGQCVACQPQCTGKQCGDDGCGGTCSPGCISYFDCYQESANIQKIVDDNCELNYTGSYYAPSLDTFFYINYTKPARAVGATWQVKHGNIPAYNITLPEDCWNADEKMISFRMESNSNNGTGKSISNLYCYNKTDWKKIGVSSATNLITLPIPGPSADNPSQIYDGNWDTYGGSATYSTTRFWVSGTWDEAECLAPVFPPPCSGYRIYEEAIIWNISSSKRQSCNEATGQCVACQPQCAGKQCGDDGCDNVCGKCTNSVCDPTGNCVVCFDSDGGNNYLVPGHVTFFYKGEIYNWKDFCYAFAGTIYLRDFICSSNPPPVSYAVSTDCSSQGKTCLIDANGEAYCG